MTRPNFIIIGASRSGTTSLHHYLKQHPEVYMCPKKSPNYFASKIKQPDWESKTLQNMAKQWISTWDDYLALFSNATNQRVIGEVSPVYLQALEIPTLIKNNLPNTKIIAILRNPIDRAYTHFIGRKRDGLDTRSSFEEVISEELSTPLPQKVVFGHYLGCSFYYHFLQEYYKLFPKEHIKIYLFEDFKKNPQKILTDLYQFLGIDSSFIAKTDVLHNKTGIIKNPILRFLWTKSVDIRTSLRPYIPAFVRNSIFPLIAKDMQKPPLSKATQQKLTKLFYDDVKNLESLTGKDLSSWLL